MGIGEQFAGLDMKNLIGGPLSAAAESSIMLAKSTADFINQVGFDSEQQVRNVSFKYTKSLPEADGSISKQEMGIDVPLLAIVPIPNLQIDEVNILFDMEVKQSEKSDSSLDATASLSAKIGWGPVSVNISGSVSSHSSNTRSSDNSAKYHVDVRATNHGIPEGLARVLDMMAASLSPNVLSTKPVDESGKEIGGARKERYDKMKQLQQKKFQLESATKNASEIFDIKLNKLKDDGKKQYQAYDISLLESENKDDSDTVKKATAEKRENSKKFWDDFQSTIKDNVIKNASLEETARKAIATIYPAKDDKGIPDISGLDNLFIDASKAYADYKQKEATEKDNAIEYNNVMSDTPADTTKPATP